MSSGDYDKNYRQEIEHYRNMVDSTKSFVTPAIITLVLYMVLWVPGLIANIMYLKEASSIQKRTGRAPDGKGCLTSLIVVFGGIIGLGVLIVVIAAIGSGS